MGYRIENGNADRTRSLGKHPKKFDHRTLQLARYMPKLPAPPASVDHALRLPVDIGMMGNDQLGDCTVAAAAHMVQSWSIYAERGIETIPDSAIIDAYAIVSPNDTGAFALDVLNLWRKTGIGPDKIEAFVEVAAPDLTQAKLAIQCFGSCYVGMSLPDVNIFGPWTTPTSPANPSNGHMVCLLAYDDARQTFRVATWGEVWDMSYAWFLKYVDEAYAVMNDIMVIQDTGKSPEGFDWAALQYDIAHLGDPVTPPGPAPAPTPPPTPAAGHFTITSVENPNYLVFKDGQRQTPTHSSPFEAAEHAGDLCLAEPTSEVLIKSAGTWKVEAK